jgi:hypothetical protein
MHFFKVRRKAAAGNGVFTPPENRFAPALLGILTFEKRFMAKTIHLN